MIKEKFLATTALQSFWDTSGKIIFLGPWCLLPKEEDRWKSLDYEIMPSPWNDRQAYYKAGKYTYNIYHYFLDILTDYLNNVHNTNHGKRFWQIVIGPWLLHFIEAFYDRYVCIKKAIDNYYPFETILLDEKSYLTPQNYEDFFDLYCGDFYNLQLYSQVLRQLGFLGRVKNGERCAKANNTAYRGSIKSFIKKGLHVLSRYIAAKRSILLWDMYLSVPHQMQYVLASNFKSFPLLFADSRLPEYPVNFNKGRQGLSYLQSRDEFSKILISSLQVNFPTLYLEGYKSFLEMQLKQFNIVPKVLMTATGWYYNESLKFLAAHWMEKGSILCGFQHGGLYGTAKWMPPEYHERQITDHYFTWGWDDNNDKNLKPMPNPKISCLVKKGLTKRFNEKNKQLLFVGTAHPRYLYRHFSAPVSDLYEEYIDWRNTFLSNLSKDNRDNILLRLYPVEYGRAEDSKIKKLFPEIRFDNRKLKYLDQLEITRLVIIDHPVTTMLESLARNIPTILYWNPGCWELRDEAQSFFEEIASVKIWHKDPASAAQFLNKISNNPLMWWYEEETQRVRKRFVDQFALSDKKWAERWWHKMKSILA